MASDAAPIRDGHVDSTVQQLPYHAYPAFTSSKGATAVSSVCSVRRVISAVASIVVTVILAVVIVVAVRRASRGKDVLTGKAVSPSPSILAPTGPGPKVCQPPPTTQPGVSILGHLLSATGGQNQSSESTAASWNPVVLPPPTPSPSTPAEFKDVIVLRFTEAFDPVLQATQKRLQQVTGGRRLLASNVTEKDLFQTVQGFKPANGFMNTTVLGEMVGSTLPKLAGLVDMLDKWYYSTFSRTIVMHARTKLGPLAHKLLEALPTDQLEFLDYSKAVYKSQAAALRPNDPNFGYQWALPKIGVVPTTGSTTSTGQQPAWAITQGSSDIVVAVFDSGVDYTHPDLEASMWVNAGEIPGNGVDDDNNGYIDDVYGVDFVNGDSDPMDDDGHGSHCSGIIAATASNREGIAGVAPNVKIMALKVLDAQGVGRTDQQIQAHDYAMRMGVHITSNSYGGDSSDPALEASLKNLADQGILFVASSGNEHRDTDVVPSYPASSDHPNIISVAASDENDCFTNFSNYGAKSVHLAAPGQLIISTAPTSIYPDGYLLMSGTSQAAPHVAATAALVLSEIVLQGGTAAGQAERVKQIILQSVAAVPSFQGFLVTGGRLDAAAAVAAARGGSAGRRLRAHRRQLRH